MTAYDYDKQQWITGPDAVPLRLRQIALELQSLGNVRYVSMMGLKQSEVSGMKQNLENEAKELRR